MIAADELSISTQLETEHLIEYLELVLNELKNRQNQPGMESYISFLHGQIFGIALALKMLHPGPGNWGEKAAFMVRPVVTEHNCVCEDEH